MRLYNWLTLPLTRNAFPSPTPFKKKSASTRVALLLAVLFVFAAAAFSLAAAAESHNTGAAPEEHRSAPKSTGGVAEASFSFSQGQDPGDRYAASSMISDQKAGSVLIFPVYCSLTIAPNMQNTRINITNTDADKDALVHIFLVDGNTCSVSDAFICLTKNQTTSFLTSDLDPGIWGYLIAVAVDANGCPTEFNKLIGDEYVKIGGLHAANLGAIAISALPGLSREVVCSENSNTAQLNFNGLSYNPLPRVLAADNLPDRASGNETMLILDRIGGSLLTSASKLGSMFGLLYDDVENAFSFSFFFDVCQFRAILSNNFPRTAPRYSQIIPPQRSGWMKLWQADDGAIIGVMINFNPNQRINPSAFNQGHNLHALTFTTTATLTIPVFPPSC
jgi:hypothetical protein